ncbi:MAG: hypothetical protein ACXVEE_39560 [Polyangiales bacterium]
MRRIELTLLCALFALLGIAGCQQEKSKAEKHAEEMAAEKASASAAAKASAAVVDPKEEKFAAARKALKERASAQMTALEKLYRGATEADRTAFREFFAPTKEGEKDADAVSKEAVVAAKDTGASIKKWEIQDLSVDSELTSGVVDVYVEESQAGKARCVTYKLDWKDFGGTFKRTARRDFRIVSCS